MEAMSRSKLRRGWSGTFAVAALILLAGTSITRAASTTAWSATYRATEAIHHVLGTKRAIGYFQTSHGQCEVTLMIAEVVDPGLAMPLSAASVPIPKFASPCGTLCANFGIVGTLATL
jgi:hypothetical protein